MSENRQSGSDDVHGIYVNLRGDKCACGDAKLPGKSFCRRDYFSLPRAMRNALYQSDGYVAAFRDALKFLGLEEPTCDAEAERRRRALTRGPLARNRKLFRDV